MSILSIVLILFIILESLNTYILFFYPGTTKGNGLGVFKSWQRVQKDEEIFGLVSYLTNWVAGVKLIFILLVLVIALVGSDLLKLLSISVLILSIATFYWRLYPIIKSLDDQGMIQPKGYSKTLGIMIGLIIGVLCLSLLVVII